MMAAPTIGLILAAPRRSLGGKGADIQPLSQEMNTLQEGEALDQPADPVVHGKPGLLRRRMAVAAAPPTDGLLEGWGKPSLAAALDALIGRHGRILDPIMPGCGSARSWPWPTASPAAPKHRLTRRSTSMAKYGGSSSASTSMSANRCRLGASASTGSSPTTRSAPPPGPAVPAAPAGTGRRCAGRGAPNRSPTRW